MTRDAIRVGLAGGPFLPYFQSFCVTQFGSALIPLTLAAVALRHGTAGQLGLLLAAHGYWSELPVGGYECVHRGDTAGMIRTNQGQLYILSVRS